MLNIKRFAGLQTKEGVVFTYVDISPSVQVEPGVWECTQEYDPIYVGSTLYKKGNVSMESLLEPVLDSDMPF